MRIEIGPGLTRSKTFREKSASSTLCTARNNSYTHTNENDLSDIYFKLSGDKQTEKETTTKLSPCLWYVNPKRLIFHLEKLILNFLNRCPSA